MSTQIIGGKCIGIEAVEVIVEVEVESGIGLFLVGLADTAVRESLMRTTSALSSSGFRLPGKKIVINLAPADLRKSGSGYDLPIAVGIIAASGQSEMPEVSNYLIMGELGLDGSVRAVPGSLVLAELAGRLGLKGVILPYDSAAEATDIEGIEVYGVRTLAEAVDIAAGHPGLETDIRAHGCARKDSGVESGPECDFADIIGQEQAKRGLEIAAAGGHNVIMIGSPGSGKTSLAKALVGIMPPLSREEALVTGKIYSVAGLRNHVPGLATGRPFRAPHYSASTAALVGGGQGDNIVPGEISLAHNGVLFLDEFGQMPKSATEALRAPMEDRKVVISRMRAKVEFPASFMLVAASNPCPCGYFGEGDRCTCNERQRENYMARLSGPMLDRMDVQLAVRAITPEAIFNRRRGERSASIALRVRAARERQLARFRRSGLSLSTNAEMNNVLTDRFCVLGQEAKSSLLEMMKCTGLSVRGYYRILKVARTIADLEGSEEIRPEHIIEAASFRCRTPENPLRKMKTF